MSPHDPRHGSYAGYGAGCRCEACTRASRNYHKRLEWDTLNGRPRRVSAVGFTRRYRALQWLGWSAAYIAERLDMEPSNLRRDARHRQWVSTEKHEAMASLYDELSMTLCPHERADLIRSRARRNGYAPPLGWDDIDTDPEPTLGSLDDDIDEVVVTEILAGRVVPSTKAEKYEVTRRWMRAGRPLVQLEQLTGWRAERYVDRDQAVAS